MRVGAVQLTEVALLTSQLLQGLNTTFGGLQTNDLLRREEDQIDLVAGRRRSGTIVIPGVQH